MVLAFLKVYIMALIYCVSVFRYGVSSQIGWLDIPVGSTYGTTRWASGNMNLSGPMKCQWSWLELRSTIR